MWRYMEIRMKEHKRACDKYIDWDNVEVLDQENDLCRRKVKEGIEIRLTNKN